MKIKETELAKSFVEYFNDQFEVFQEVPHYGGYIDIVAVSKPIRIGIEVKTTLSIALIEQCVKTSKSCNYTYAAIPRIRSSFGLEILESYGIGVLEKGSNGVREILKPRLNRHAKNLRLTDEMKLQVAGSQSTERITVFKMTVQEMERIIEKNGGKIPLKNLAAHKFHWGGISSARSCIKNYCDRGVITSFRIENGIAILNK